MRVGGLGIAVLALALAACSGPRQPAGASDGKTLVTTDKAPVTAASAASEDVAVVDPDGNQIEGISKSDLDDAIKRQNGEEGGFQDEPEAPADADKDPGSDEET